GPRRKRRKSYLFATLVFILGMGGTASPAAGPEPALRGVAISLDASTELKTVEKALREVRDLGANSVLFKVAEAQTDWRSNILRPNPELTAPLLLVENVLRSARSLGFKIVFMPVVLLETPRTRKDWRGMIVPDDLERWFRSYRHMILKYGRISQAEKVEYFSVGSELVSMEPFPSLWSGLIDEVRSVYRGVLFYSFNWDHRSETPAWSRLDLIGINTYNEMAQIGEEPTAEQLAHRWKSVRSKVIDWSRRLGKNILITEAGYPSRKNGLVNPWDHTVTGGIPDESVQRLGYGALLEAWNGEPRLEGLLFYEWQGVGGNQDTGYTPRGKASETLLKLWMRESYRGTKSEG
ncbi:MAG TPA: hypothetical protein VI895_14955, partial [Bdellovibrionota bacterium]|nr:hypothetical protein [Bdellovibrionota bacterium]